MLPTAHVCVRINRVLVLCCICLLWTAGELALRLFSPILLANPLSVITEGLYLVAVVIILVATEGSKPVLLDTPLEVFVSLQYTVLQLKHTVCKDTPHI